MDNDREVSSLLFVSKVKLNFDAIGLTSFQLLLTEIYFATLSGDGTLWTCAEVATPVVGDVVMFLITILIFRILSFA